jgi:trk system potassium uptake protein TrkH
MRIGVILHIIGFLFLFLTVFMIFPLLFSLHFEDGDFTALISSLIISFVLGLSLVTITWRHHGAELRIREGFAIVTMGWVSLAAVGALPFYLSGVGPTFTDSFFESMSGFTTTGASILTYIEGHPRGVLFWRSLTHWIGGMGIILFSIAILPLLGVGGMQLYRAEVPGPTVDRLKPRIRETAKALWLVYLFFTAAETILLMFGGMSFYEALCHTFGTMATGGFSTRDASIGAFNSAYFDTVIIIFMVIAGTNFALHYRALAGNIRAYVRDREFLYFTGIILIATVAATVNLRLETYSGLGQAFRGGLFQVVSITTTTGYVTADYEGWSSFMQYMMLLLMFVGGCGGSTGGSIKIIRIVLLLKGAHRELRKLIHPQAVLPIRIGHRTVSQEVMTNILGFFLLYMFLFALATAVMTLLGLDLLTALASVAATIGNIGPALGTVGPAENYFHLPLLGKWVLSFFNDTATTEIYTVFLIFLPEFWRR